MTTASPSDDHLGITQLQNACTRTASPGAPGASSIRCSARMRRCSSATAARRAR